MKFIRFVVFILFFAPVASFAVPNDFAVAAQLLAAAKNADVQQVQVLINSGANVNYVDSTGLSLVCTALMNNDLRAAQILQMYGADASMCDRQIKNYRTRTVPERTGGIFGGLSAAQGMTLAAAGAAVVVGGLFLLTDVFNPDDDNNVSGGSSSGGGGGSGGGSTSNPGTALFSSNLPDGPESVKSNYNYSENISVFYLGDVWSDNFAFMNDNVEVPNYLLLMRGYSPFARGYLGQRTLRGSNYTPLVLDDGITGGRPINVAVITANGVNAADGTSLRDNVYVSWGGGTGGQVTGVSNKYYNNTWTVDAGVYSTIEDLSFDLSNSGTAIHNSLAGTRDNLLAQIVGGYTDGADAGDFVGFMPNGQMTIYRTGGGNVMSAVSVSNVGTYTTFESGATIGLMDKTWTVSLNENSVVLTDVSNSNNMLNGYLGGDGNLYLDTVGNDGIADVAYEMSGNVFNQVKESQSADYYNYYGLLLANGLRTNTTDASGRSKVDVIANASVIEPLRSRSAPTISTVTASTNPESTFYNLIALYYGNTSSDDMSPASNAYNFFTDLSTAPVYKKTNSMDNLSAPLVVFSTGGVALTTYEQDSLLAGFENAAPLIYPDLEHLFMSVVAVEADTSDATSIVANTNTMPVSGTQYKLSQWTTNGTEYVSRRCGIAGTGNGTIDPWCFAAVGGNDEMATASAAGAAGILASAFHYMTPEQIFMLLALTADGPYLARLTTATGTGSGTLLSTDDLIEHLQTLYQMPNGYESMVSPSASYLDAFKEIFGYGVINLERATTPGTNLYYYVDGKILSSPKNAYWRAATNTGFRGSGALNIGRGTIRTAAYDVLESFDGSMSLPRIWETNIAFGTDAARGLYMGDVLGDLATRTPVPDEVHIGNMSFSFARSEREYYDGLGGLDNMRFSYDKDNVKMSVDFQRYLTDGESRFFGMSNPIMGLASNAITGGAGYSYGNWSFGARGFSGAITDEGLLANDPAISAIFEPARLGGVSGAATNIGWHNEHFGLTGSVGAAHESNTVLGAYSTGLMDIGSADTNYIDFDAVWRPIESVRLRARATFAHTNPTAGIGATFRFSSIDSNAFAFGTDIGNLSFGASLPLASVRGILQYEYADYEIIDRESGGYALNIADAGVRSIRLCPDAREVRLNASWRHSFGEFTDGAFGFIYRINPNNTRDFGNESVFMMKLSHRIGI